MFGARTLAAIFAALLIPAASPAASRQEPPKPDGKLPSIEEKTREFEKLDGFFPLYWEERAGTLWLEIPRSGVEVLYVTSLASGLGSNDIGLDRGQLGQTRIVRFDRVGPKVLMVQPNYQYRATTTNPDEARAVEEAFAPSVVWGFTAAAETGGRVLVNATDFLLRDAHGVIQSLQPATYRLEAARSAVYMPRTKAFPRNSEMEALLTFVTDAPTNQGPGQSGGRIQDVAASADAITLRQHHSLVALPDAGYTPRAFDPRGGFFAVRYRDYSAPLGEPIDKRFIVRHRLEKKAPRAQASEAVEPIVYYLDRGTPEPIRSALLDGAQWWNLAFEDAGFRNAFRVEIMPEGADMLDVRYNVIQWVHRSTRGWSYGASVVDPRTGEIVKGHVTLGSLRVRQDYLLAEGLLSPYTTGSETPSEPSELALARLRQLSAHEVGHTLGLGHNYYDSTAGRISVMDYPHPLVTLKPDGSLDLSDAYATGIGAWDKVAIRWGYGDPPPASASSDAIPATPAAPGDGTAALTQILDEAWAQDLRYLTNQDIDHSPQADQWSNGTDPAAELTRMMQVRRVALDRFGERAIPGGRPMATMEEPLVPLFLHHRYQVEAAASAIGGTNYIYALRGDGREPRSPVSAAAQMAALEALLATIAPSELTLPRAVVDTLPPRPAGYPRHRELFPRFTGMPLDPIAPALVAASHTVGLILQPERAARLVAQSALDPALPGLDAVITRLVAASFDAPAADAYEREVARAVQRVVVERLMALAAGAEMAQVRAIALAHVKAIGQRPVDGSWPAGERAHFTLLADDIRRFLERPAEEYKLPSLPPPPPGAPIGQMEECWVPPGSAVD